ncbi:hypothetical protein MN113_16325 [Pseudomonas veronii]|uniref:hypothetical protein n=1 Tax=Pseudomonas veronii TaxID=76761 RepID=UPI0021C1D052|nr:hypothetical protein [Pseudomonas veronii]MCT8962753.1 hypothetical protein [Pseudomonas veronii]
MCYEIRFPEVIRTLALEGSRHRDPVGRLARAGTPAAGYFFNTVRAAEDIVAPNPNKRDGVMQFIGTSDILEPPARP